MIYRNRKPLIILNFNFRYGTCFYYYVVYRISVFANAVHTCVSFGVQSEGEFSMMGFASFKRFAGRAPVTFTLLGCLAMAASPAHAGFILDTKIGAANLGSSGDAVEMQALANILGVNVNTLTLDLKITAPVAVQNVGTSDQWFLDVTPDTPGYFMLKFGNGAGATDDHFFFKNIGELTKLVWSNSQVEFLTGGCAVGSCNIGKLSHFVTVDGSGGGGSNGDVPEPSSVALSGLGLAVVAALRRRKI
jgi:hypothetical protein